MNVRFLLKIPFKLPQTLPDGTEGYADSKAVLNVDTMLDPYFISESTLMGAFMEEEEYGKYGQKAREIAFNSSVRAWEYTKFKLTHLPDEQKIVLVRELALCMAMNSFAQFFFKGFQESLHRSKTYAEFTVTTTIKNNPAALRDVIDGSNKCLNEIKAEIERIDDLWNSLGAANLKGAWNDGNNWSWRMWFHNSLPERSRDIVASENVWHYNGNRYKGGVDVSESRADYKGRAARSPVYHY